MPLQNVLVLLFILLTSSFIIPNNCTTNIDCNLGLVCLNATCNNCTLDSQCNNVFDQCKIVKGFGVCQRKSLFHNFHFVDVLLGLMAIIIGGFSSVSGIGGSAIMVPLLKVIGRFEVSTAISISKAFVFGTAFVTVIIIWRKKLPGTLIPLIDFRLLTIFTPMILLGTISGVLVILFVPEILLLAALMIVLPYASYKTIGNGVKMYKKEKEDALKENKQETEVEVEVPLRENNMPVYGNLFYVILIWGIVIIIAVFQGGFGSPSIIGVQSCSIVYWSLLALNFPLILIFVVAASYFYYRRELRIPSEEKQFKFTKNNVIILPYLSFFSGLLSTSLGAAMIRNTILLELGTDVAVASATCSFVLFFDASISTILFLINGTIPLDYGLYFLLVGFVSAIFGQFIISKILERFKRRSVFVFFLGILIVIATIAMGGDGLYNMIISIKNGQNIWQFKSFCTQ